MAGTEDDQFDYGDDAGAGWDGFEPTPLDRVSFLIPDFDVSLQLAAIRGMFRRARAADAALTAELDGIAEHARKVRGLANQHAIDEWGERFYTQIYQDAAHSLAAVGMLAPTIEGVLRQLFAAIGSRYFSDRDPDTGHDRWRLAGDQRWDCCYVGQLNAQSAWQKDVYRGIIQLSEATGVLGRFPEDIRLLLQVLFRYRNKIFHHGLEWPQDERERFAAAIDREGWPSEWFALASSAGHPWIYCLSEAYVDRCLAAFEELLTQLGAFCEDLEPQEASG